MENWKVDIFWLRLKYPFQLAHPEASINQFSEPTNSFVDESDSGVLQKMGSRPSGSQ
jgi:hypothetical protein